MKNHNPLAHPELDAFFQQNPIGLIVFVVFLIIVTILVFRLFFPGEKKSWI